MRGRDYIQAHRARVPATVGVGSQRADHPLIELQRTAGNRAVTQLVQRRAKPFHFSKVANALMDDIYTGKCDAKLEAPSVTKKWSRGLTGKQRALIFECGPQSFGFRSFRGWFGEGFPWALDLVDESPAWVLPSIEGALDDVLDDMDDAGPQFWRGYHTIKAALADDLANFCGGKPA